MIHSKFDFLTNEFITGELLSEKLARGPLSADEAVRLAIEIGAALHRVHTSGGVHGQLSPFCIALPQAGARILRPSASPEDSAAYRSPEQLRGENPDVRSDVFAYGAVVYEIASGRRAFPGVGTELAQRIQKQDPEPLDGQSLLYQTLDKVIAGCIEKDPARRRQRVQNAVIELKLGGGSQPRPTDLVIPRQPLRKAAPPPAPEAVLPEPPVSRSAPGPVAIHIPRPTINIPRSDVGPYAAQVKAAYGNTFRRRFGLIGAGVLLLAATSVAAVFYLNKKPAAPVVRFSVTQPEHTSYPGMPSVSPDGRYLAFSAVGPEGKRMLWLRPLDALHATVIPGSEGASAPFWSPDSQMIGFFGGKNLQKVRISGGAPEVICAAEASPGGGAWNKDGTILFSPSLSDGFYRISASGGKPQPVLTLNEAKGEHGDLWPQFLPDGKHFIFFQQTDNAETSGVYVGSLDQPDYRRLFTSQTNAVYSAADPGSPKTGFLLYINDRDLTSLEFNTSRLETSGEPRVLANDIGAVRSLALAPISVSATGVLVYQGVGQPTRELLWMDRGGRQITVAGTPGEWGPVRISPDGHRAAAAKLAPDSKVAHLWLLDVGGTAEQISPDSSQHEGSPVWAPDSAHLAYFARQGEAADIYTRSTIANSRSELLFKNSGAPTDWSHDGRFLLFGQAGAGTKLNVWGISVGDRRTAPILDTVYSESFGAISPDGKWLAYQSDQSGRNEVYIQQFDGLSNGTKRRWMVSKSGGLPRWRSDSAELFYMTPDGRMMTVSIRPSSDGGVETGAPQRLFQTRPVPKTWNLYDVSPDGQRFLLNLPLEWTSAAPITVITNWTEKLKD
ncbi:MAG: domain protein beta Propeller [Candidatus Solibacter sp.]|nr:domain protein beta Propeller [Candidatus Solibacter sp.]